MVGVWPEAALGYDGGMPDPLTSMVLVLALAAGLAAAIVVAQHAQTGQAEFYRYYLTHILLFNLLILAGLVFRFIQPQAQVFPSAIPVAFSLMAALKLGWLFAFIVSTRLLSGITVPGNFTGVLARAGLILFVTYLAATWIAWVSRTEALLNAAMFLLESIVLGGALLAAIRLILAGRAMHRGSRRKSLLIFGVFHSTLLLVVIAALAVSWIRPGPQEFAQVVINGVFLLLFNLFPPVWIWKFRPAPGIPVSGKFESMGVTPREREIIHLIQAGKTNQEIADELFISLATVKDHNNNLFRKCGVRNRVELANLFR